MLSTTSSINSVMYVNINVSNVSERVSTIARPTKIFRRLLRTTMYASVLQRVLELHVTYSTYASVFAKFFIRRHTLAKSSRCDRALM